MGGWVDPLKGGWVDLSHINGHVRKSLMLDRLLLLLLPSLDPPGKTTVGFGKGEKKIPK